MDNGAMFGDVMEFINQDYFEKHKEGTLYLPGRTRHITLFACVRTNAADSVIYNPDAQSPETMAGFLSYIEEKSVQYREIPLENTDSVIGLSTCAGAETNGRVIVFGRLD